MDIFFNRFPLEARRKAKLGHYKKDLPYHITDAIIEGENVLDVYLRDPGLTTCISNYWIAVEVIEPTTPDAIIQTAKRNAKSANAVLDRIKEQLSALAVDEEVIALTDKIVSVRDPFSSTLISELPTRSIHCQHNDCFSLEYFIDSRSIQAKPNDHYSVRDLPPEAATEVDVWRCPICLADARPPTLFIDQWMLSVRNQLIAHGQTGARDIVVNAEGQWEAKIETGVDNGKANETRREEQVEKSGDGHEGKPDIRRGNSSRKNSEPPVVISLLDDD
jgi:hypothetical protein